ncbi:aminotransferase class I/II-fold pyridoxal phosphate-dependent enzyme [Tumebacillus permanentifrigoris]|uniref:8-amino-7-oxononanoate synthase n=1 Tax=Tumebacillus permanentifrigoris TaxID=378543 RepID=A0A316D9C8_9BACL|nr:8-amino-7-oxononanoate synthase [Tumebacillus permanentifrigoris]PWK13791.1 8-amino-7-oxononanoate synthase [Tumebacillus permanentifrigoris]
MDFKSELDAIRDAGLYRRLRRMESASSRVVVVEGREMLMCASNNYLGLADEPLLQETAIEAIRQFGTGSGGSRLTTGNTALHEHLERELAEFKGTEAALLFNTGYMANLAALTTLVGSGDLILSDSLNHASLIDGARLSRADVQIYEHCNLTDLEKKLAVARGLKTSESAESAESAECISDSRIRSRKGGLYDRILIVTDGVFSMDGDIAPLPGICDLAERYGADVMVDDAHATGVLGSKGAGTADHFNCQTRVAVQMGTLSKALGAEGGYIAGSRDMVEYLINRARPFIYSTAMSPAGIGAVLAALQIVKNEPVRRSHLLVRAKRLRHQLLAADFEVLPSDTPILGIVLGEADHAVQFARELEAVGVFAPAIRPPTVPAGTSRIRLTLTASHTDADMDSIVKAFQQARTNLAEGGA